MPKINIEKLINLYPVNNIWLVYVGVLGDLSRLPLTKAEQKILDDFNAIEKLHNDFEIYKAFEKVMPETILLYAILKDEKSAVKYLEELSRIKLSINGKDLQGIGLAPSPKYQEIFDYVLKQKLQSPNMSKTDEIEAVKNYLDI